ncbi:hypothetical protein DENSPDRAFT_587909 [Dentipellis sp. KUC8613]|nr:hypothetical protein DENSPDRAFT_587909 [Dentipellis sp. KUC8613]
MFSRISLIVTLMCSRVALGQISHADYSWIDDDYPYTWPPHANEAWKVFMYPEDTHRYALDTAAGAKEWRALIPGTSNGTVYLGPRRRPFTIAMFHQLQCLDILRLALVDEEHAGDGLVHHCMNYLRQMSMCQANTHLESVRSDIGPKITDLTRGGYVCQDWRVLYDLVE